MSVDRLQNQIRKLKNPSALELTFDAEQLPPHLLLEEESVFSAFERFGRELLLGLKDLVPAVRFSFGSFCVQGPEGVRLLQVLLTVAKEEGYYVLLDGPQTLSVQETAVVSLSLLGENSQWSFDALVLSCYLGSDALKPFVEKIKNGDKSLFVVLRTGNKSASELQDLLTGTRLVHTVAADMAKRLGEGMDGRCGYSAIGGLGAATAQTHLQTLRTKYPTTFLLVDGYDYSGSNGKTCSVAFDRLGHGAIVCAGRSITESWKTQSDDSREYVNQAVAAAERMKKNLTRYVTIL